MTATEYKAKLIELHNTIKENPFRRDYVVYAKYGTGYFDTLYEFANTFFYFIYDIQQGKIETSDTQITKIKPVLFFHDFKASIGRGYNAAARFNELGDKKYLEYLHNAEEHLELCISCIHCYLETGMLERYPFKFRGNIRWATWDNEREEYIADFSE